MKLRLVGSTVKHRERERDKSVFVRIEKIGVVYVM